MKINYFKDPKETKYYAPGEALKELLRITEARERALNASTTNVITKEPKWSLQELKDAYNSFYDHEEDMESDRRAEDYEPRTQSDE